ncbi:hypothetical protein V1514DRAFT_264341, partial [Lipomyces japonicus]|uniref:uncharacterized protein n=1 Tax=Lipomyces japonicus TaxID=56871 RepID=UPI0034CFE1E5
TQLALYDDFLTQVLIDTLYFWVPIHKVHPARRASRGPNALALIRLLRDGTRSSSSDVLARFLELPAVKSFYSGHVVGHDGKRNNKINKLRHEFGSHARKYLNMYAVHAGFELGTTDRYLRLSGRTETCVLARRVISKGQQVRHLDGRMVVLSNDEELRLKRDFSIIYSHRLSESCLMLGPCRFVNHDCQPNARFQGYGQGGVMVIMTRDVTPGEEITVSYAENYFGKRNKECMCATCQGRGKGYFRPLRVGVQDKNVDASSRLQDHDEEEDGDGEDDDDDDDEDDKDDGDHDGVKLHRTRARKRQRMEERVIKTMMPTPSPSPPASSKNNNSISTTLAAEPEQLGLKFVGGVR